MASGFVPALFGDLPHRSPLIGPPEPPLPLVSHFQAPERPRRSVPDHPNELNVAAEGPMVPVVIDAQHEPVLRGIGAGPERLLLRRQHEPAPKIRSLARSAAPK